MSKPDKARYAPRTTVDAPEQGFASAEEAWFWYMRAQRARHEGARLAGGSIAFQRPCNCDDLYRWVMGLYRRRRLSANALRVLAAYGWREVPPDARLPTEASDARIWENALTVLGRELEARGVIEGIIEGCAP